MSEEKKIQRVYEDVLNMERKERPDIDTPVAFPDECPPNIRMILRMVLRLEKS